MRYQDLTGVKFGELTVLKTAARRGPDGAEYLECSCSCGSAVTIAKSSLTGGRTKSCGHFKTEKATTHGMSRSPEYSIWVAMNQRCGNARNRWFKRYGGRGIKVCARWHSSFANFIEDMGRRPAGTTIERIDNESGYEPGNCKWATQREQVRNTSRNHFIELGGESLPLQDWAERFGLPYNTILYRLGRGWSVRDALTLPPKHKSSRKRSA